MIKINLYYYFLSKRGKFKYFHINQFAVHSKSIPSPPIIDRSTHFKAAPAKSENKSIWELSLEAFTENRFRFRSG